MLIKINNIYLINPDEIRCVSIKKDEADFHWAVIAWIDGTTKDIFVGGASHVEDFLDKFDWDENW